MRKLKILTTFILIILAAGFMLNLAYAAPEGAEAMPEEKPTEQEIQAAKIQAAKIQAEKLIKIRAIKERSIKNIMIKEKTITVNNVPKNLGHIKHATVSKISKEDKALRKLDKALSKLKGRDWAEVKLEKPDSFGNKGRVIKVAFVPAQVLSTPPTLPPPPPTLPPPQVVPQAPPQIAYRFNFEPVAVFTPRPDPAPPKAPEPEPIPEPEPTADPGPVPYPMPFAFRFR